MSARAELIADRGAAVFTSEVASSGDFFRSRPFLGAEGVTHTLRIETGETELLAPLIVREIPPPGPDSAHTVENRPVAPEVDAISPYGYPGVAAPAGAEIDPAGIDFSAAGLVSAFVRHTLGPPPLVSATTRNTVQIADPALPRKSRMSDRQQIRKNQGRGYELRVIRGTDTTPAQRAGFLAAYEQTMRRTEAAERYFFGAAYFDRILEARGAWLVMAHAPGGEMAAASIATQSDGHLHYYLSGTADSYLRDSPMKSILDILVDHATVLDLPLNLGGGITPGDPLEEFKRGFANREQPWHTSELICDRAAYARLSQAAPQAAGSTYFPAYRSPA